MRSALDSFLRWLPIGILLFFLAYPFTSFDGYFFAKTNHNLGADFTNIFIFCILAMGLNVVLGYTGILHLGIAAFFGAGAYIAAILTVPIFPFQLSFFVALIAGTLGAGLLGLLLGAPTLRLRGDYLALVTLGFGQVINFAFLNLNNITNGSRGLNPVPSPPAALAAPLASVNLGADWAKNYEPFYYLTLLLLVVVYGLLRNLERSRIGRAWMAIREDELAATCMGVSATRVKLSAFALGAAVAGLAGVLHATKSTQVSPGSYDFSRSMIILCCVILGGIGSLPGCIVGVVALIGFDNILSPMLDSWIQKAGIVEWIDTFDLSPEWQIFLKRIVVFANWRLLIYGLVLIFMMRFRPAGLIPSRRLRA